MKCPMIQRVACSFHSEKVGAICSKCYDLALQEQQQQWAKQRKEAHKEYLRRETRVYSHV